MKRNINKESILTKDMVESIMRDYDLKVKGVKEVRNVYRIETDRGKKLLKKTTAKEKELKLVYEALEYLAKKGFRKISRFIITKYGDPYIRNGKDLYYLTDWVDGRECKLHKQKYLEEAVKTIAEFHLASIGYTQNDYNGRNRIGNWQDRFYKRSNELLQLKEMVKENKYRTQFDEIFLANFDKIYEFTQKALELLILSDYRTLMNTRMELGGFCHSGLSTRNLIKGKRGIQIIDFDNLKFDLHLLDLGRFMLKYLPKYQWDINIANAIINNYTNIIELDKQQMEILIAYLIFPHRFWRLVHRYYNKHSQLSEADFVNKLEKSLRNVNDLYIFIQNFSTEFKIDLTKILNIEIENRKETVLSEENLGEEGINITDYIKNEENRSTEDKEENKESSNEEIFDSP